MAIVENLTLARVSGAVGRAALMVLGLGMTRFIYNLVRVRMKFRKLKAQGIVSRPHPPSSTSGFSALSGVWFGHISGWYHLTVAVGIEIRCPPWTKPG
jgi:hypothetical protein